MATTASVFAPAVPLAPQQQGMTAGRIRLLTYAFYAASALLFNYVYFAYSSLMWGYMGLAGNLQPARLAVSTVVFTLFVVALPRDSGPRAFFLHCFVLLYLMPALFMFGYNDFSLASFLTIVGAGVILFATSMVRVAPPIRRALSLRAYAFGTVAVTALLILALVFIGGFRTFNLDFAQVYAFRDEAAENLPPVFGYIVPIFTKTIIPFGIAAALHYRYRNFALVLIAASIVLFGITSHKIMLFAPILTAVTYLALTRLNPLVVLLAGTTALLVGVAAAVSLSPNLSVTSLWGWIESLFVWRSLILPAFLDYQHLTFFADNARFYWSNSQVTLGLVSSPYGGVPIAQVIGLAMFSDATMVANAGFIGNGYAQAGVVGVVFYAVGIGLILSLLETTSKVFDPPFVIAANLTLVLTMLVSADLFSMFLTHGLLIGLALMVTLKPEQGQH